MHQSLINLNFDISIAKEQFCSNSNSPPLITTVYNNARLLIWRP